MHVRHLLSISLFTLLLVASGCKDSSTTGLAGADADGDGFLAAVDCDDTNEFVNPGTGETIGDGMDNDCNPATNDDGTITGFVSVEDALTDADGDGYPAGVDCDDDDADVNPGAEEVYNDGIDNDCRADSSDKDADGDGYDAASFGGADCDDGDPTIHPGAAEIDDGVDNDCDGDALELASFDLDGDGFTSGYGSMSIAAADCNDLDAAINPGQPEIYYNGKDDDCKLSTVDDDQDGDGETVATDCDDTSANANHSLPETYYDGEDNDCDLTSDDGDRDGDGYLAAAMGGDDCQDNAKGRHPGRGEIPNDGIDQNCDGSDLTSAMAVFVNGATGSDVTGDGSAGNPYATIQKGNDEAAAGSTAAVFVAGGMAYNESVDLDVSLIGGFSGDFSSYDPDAFPTKVTATGADAIEVQHGVEVDIVGLSLTNEQVGTAAYGIDVLGSKSTVRIYAVEVSIGTTTSGTAYGIDVFEALLVDVRNSTIEVYTASSAYVLDIEDSSRFRTSDSEFTAISRSNSGTCYLIDLDAADTRFYRMDMACANTGGNFTGAYFVDSENGARLDIRDSNLRLGAGVAGNSILDTDDGTQLLFADNTIEVESGSSLSSSMFYLQYSGGDLIGNTINCTSTAVFDLDEIAYIYEAGIRFRDNSFDCANVAIDDNLYYVDDGNGEFSNNSHDIGTLETGGNDLYYMYEGMIHVIGDRLTVGTATDATDVFYGNNGRFVVQGFELSLGDHDAGGFRAVYSEYGQMVVSDSTFDIDALNDAGSTHYGAYVYNGDLELTNNSFDLGDSAGSVIAVYVDDAGLVSSNNTFRIGKADSDASIFDIDDGGLLSHGDAGDIERGDGGTAAGLVCYYAGCEVYDLEIEIGSGFDENRGIENDGDSGIEVHDSSFVLGSTFDRQSGVFWDDYGAVELYNNTFVLHGTADDAYGFYSPYDGEVILVNNVFDIRSEVTTETWGMYSDEDYVSMVAVHNYFRVGDAADNSATRGAVNMYSESYYAFVNNIFELEDDGTSATVYGLQFDSSSSEIVSTFRNNIFSGFIDTAGDFVDSDDAGQLDFAGASACDWLECAEFSGNLLGNAFLADPDNGNYHLTANSPAIDAGGDVQPFYAGTQAKQDFEGDGRGGSPDIGPDER